LPGTGGKGHLDLIAALDADRRAAGLDPERFHDLGMCTRCTPGEFFSHRREGSASGRMMAAIGIQ
jgi:copper oxidase (laccase) domain-containing protein